MVINDSILELLGDILERMNASSIKLETIAQKERTAIRTFNADMLMDLAEQRQAAYQELSALEQECRSMLHQNEHDDLPLEAIIDLLAGKRASSWQALRRELYHRLVEVDRQQKENRIRMHAARNVALDVLQHLGIHDTPQTYGPGQQNK